MIEPLNHSNQAVWPEWHQKPLHLTIPEINNPSVVIDQFFDCYHLPDIRSCLASWLQDALAKDTVECKKHISTHDQVQKLIEACWIINQNHLLTNEHTATPNDTLLVDNKRITGQHDRYVKPERLVEKANKSPMEVVAEIFTHISVMDLRDDLLPNWLRIANINDKGAYANSEERAILYEFFDQLNLLIEALLILNEAGNLMETEGASANQLKEKIPLHNRPISLTASQFTNPGAVILGFVQQFPIEYVRRELWDLLDTAISFEGAYPDWFSPWMALFTYNYVTCLIEAAYQLY
jgi:hypothetical protein